MNFKNIETVRSIYAAAMQGDVEGVLSPVAEGFALVDPLDLPWRGESRGREAFLSFATKLAVSPAPLQFDHVSTDGDRVRVEVSGTGMASGAGHAFKVHEIHTWTVQGGKAQRLDIRIEARPATTTAATLARAVR